MQAMSMLPSSITARIVDPIRFHQDLSRYAEMSDAELVRVAEVCLRNMSRIDEDSVRSDVDLRVVLAPELCDRILPGNRDRLRRISSTLPDYDPDRPSVFDRLLRPESIRQLREESADMRSRVSMASDLDTHSLVTQARFAIAGSRAADRWAPSDHVYEPGFTYRLVPILAIRALDKL